MPVSVVLFLPAGISYSLSSLWHLESIDCAHDTKDKHIKLPCSLHPTVGRCSIKEEESEDNQKSLERL